MYTDGEGQKERAGAMWVEDATRRREGGKRKKIGQKSGSRWRAAVCQGGVCKKQPCGSAFPYSEQHRIARERTLMTKRDPSAFRLTRMTEPWAPLPKDLTFSNFSIFLCFVCLFGSPAAACSSPTSLVPSVSRVWCVPSAAYTHAVSQICGRDRRHSITSGTMHDPPPPELSRD